MYIYIYMAFAYDLGALGGSSYIGFTLGVTCIYLYIFYIGDKHFVLGLGAPAGALGFLEVYIQCG